MVCAGRAQPLCQTLCPSCLCVGARYKLPEAHLQHLSYHLLVHARHWASSWEQLAISKFELKLCKDSVIILPHTAAQIYMCRVALQHCRRAWAACRTHAPNVHGCICSNPIFATLLNDSFTCNPCMYSKLYRMLCMVSGHTDSCTS